MMKKSVLLSACTMALGVMVGAGTAFGQSDLREQMIAKAKKEGTLVIGGSNATELRDKVEGFKKLYPFINVKAVGANTSDTINRAVLESKAGRLTLDLVAIDNAGAELLVARDMLQSFDFPHLADFAEGTQPTHKMYVDVVGNPRVQGVYNTNNVKPEEVPKSWEEMTLPKWKGRTLISRSSEEFAAVLAYTWRGDNKELAWDKAFDFFTKLVKNQDPKIARGYSGGNQRVAAGEVDIFWLPAIGQAVRMAVQDGAPVGLIAFPKFPVTYRSFGILKDAAHPASAWLMVDYLTSPEGQKEYTTVVSAKMVLNKKAEPGPLAKWMKENGATIENGDFADPSETAKIFTQDVVKKSEDFYFKLLGIK